MEQTKKPVWQKILKIFGICLGGLVALILAALLCVHLFTPVVYNDFFGNAQKEYKTPGLSDGLVPQGYDYISEKGLFLQVGYMTDGESASRIYITDEKTEKSRYLELYTADGLPYLGHTGGLTHKDDLLWLANDGAEDDNCVWVLDLNQVLNTENGGKITLDRHFKPETRSAFCYADRDYLWVGEFRDPEKYLTVESHHFDVSGGRNYALICAYPYDSTNESGVMSTPVLCLSIPDLVQGMARTEKGEIILSTSYGTASSHLYIYKNPEVLSADAAMTVNGSLIPVCFLDADLLIKDVKMPPMSEELVVKDDKVYVLFESACKKYIFGNFTRGRHIYSYELD